MLRMSVLCSVLVFVAHAKTVVFWEDGFPTAESEAVSRPVLERGLAGDEVAFTDIDALKKPGALSGVGLLVLPYGSAFPVEAWAEIYAFIESGGNLLVLGGRPFGAPVRDGKAQAAEEGYARALGIEHTYAAPDQKAERFRWREGYDFLPSVRVAPRRNFVLEGRHLNGLGYLENGAQEKVAAPVVVMDHAGSGARWVFLDFTPAAGFWDAEDGVKLLGAAAEYARQGAGSLEIETEFSAMRPGESPLVTVSYRGRKPRGTVELELRTAQGAVVEKRQVGLGATIDLPNSLTPGFYLLRGTYSFDGKAREFYENGFWVEEEAALEHGGKLGVAGDFLTREGKPFFPFGTNYFSTESNGWDFSGPRNAAVWERDFAEMQRQGVNFVRTGVWGGQMKITDGPDGGVSERFLRNVEAYLRCAHEHGIAVNFTFFAFDPQSTLRAGGDRPVMSLPGTNPYLDPVTIRAEQAYLLSIVRRFQNDPELSWDLINEPSFSNPRALWHGNTPDNDPAEQAAWHKWLGEQYGSIEKLARAWSVTPQQLGGFDRVPLPGAQDLMWNPEHGDSGMARAYDYNRFAQDSFSGWVKTMVAAIRATGSTQLIDVGQDEGGVEGRVLNQFYGRAGVSFTTNHTYRQNQDLLWDSWTAKVPGVPNIVGETGYQPVTYPDGSWHFDELTGNALIEQKWAAGFAAAASGALSWDWDREMYFGMERSDGSAKIWETTLHEMSAFAVKAEQCATGLVRPQVAIVLPQSLQLSVLNRLAVEAQQKSVRALYGYARGSAYAVGEDQIELLGHPKLIIVPSPWVFGQRAWEAILQEVRQGATLLVSGRIDLDEHFLPTARGTELDAGYRPELLQLRGNRLEWPQGAAELIYGEGKTDYLQRAVFADGQTFVRRQMGKGVVLCVSFPLELNDNLRAVGDVYRLALKTAGVTPVYTTTLADPNVLIAPTQFADATLFEISSQTGDTDVTFRDERSGNSFTGHLAAGRAALLLVGNNGRVLATYNWP